MVFNGSLQQSQHSTASMTMEQLGIRSLVSSQATSMVNTSPVTENVALPNIEKTKRVETVNNPTVVNTPIENLQSSQKNLAALEEGEDNKYSHKKSFPFVVELEEELLVEFNSDYSRKDQQRILSRLMVLSNIEDKAKLVSLETIDTKQRPHFFKRIVNQYKKPIRYPAQSYRYADYLLVNHTQKVKGDKGSYSIVSIPLRSFKLPQKAKLYKPWIKHFSSQSKVLPELVYAIMEVESAFNPRAVSKSNALGLMQIKATAAGKDVYQYIDGKPNQPSEKTLFNPKENIRIGTAYIGLLQNNYLKGINNVQSKEMLVISSYNGGLSSVLSLFGKTPEHAIKRINGLRPKQVYRTLRYVHQSDETKRYIEKVMRAKNRYSEILELAV